MFLYYYYIYEKIKQSSFIYSIEADKIKLNKSEFNPSKIETVPLVARTLAHYNNLSANSFVCVVRIDYEKRYI